MQTVKRSTVKPGQTFYTTERRVPLIALANETADMILKSRNGKDETILWHVYTPAATVCWTFADTDVFVD